jgi:hypothetical protein
MTKPTIVTRSGKGSALTWTEGDANLTNLRDATIIVTDGTNSKAIDLNGTITYTAGTNITLSVNSSTGALTINSTGAGAGTGANSDITSMTGITGSISSPTYIQMGSGSATTLAAGRMWYNESTGSLNFGMGNGNITQQVGEELFRYGKASSAITDSPLQLVYKTGTVGGSGVITFAPATAGITDGDQIVGCATEPIALNGFGRVTTWGIVNGITTNGTAYSETWADNDDIYYNPTTGGLTKTLPTSGLKMFIGTVIKAGSGGSGSFIVKLGSPTYLSKLTDVTLTSPATNNLLTYNGSGWVNTSASSVTVGTATSATTATKATNLVGGNGTTLLGSIPYQSGTDTTTLLSPNTTITTKYLKQVGDGTNGFAPTWAAITTLDNVMIGSATPNTGSFTTLSASGAVTLSPANLAVAISPTGTGTVAISPVGALTINPTAASTINNTSIGATTASTGRFTTVTSTIATGTAPFTVTSTTNVPNLNASSLNGATFAAPGAIGSTTASTGAFTTLSATGAVTLSPANLAVAISPTGTGTVAINPAGALTINPTAASTINNTSIGVTTAAAGRFTTLTATSTTTLATSLTGILKAASGVVSTATAGTDYVAVSGALGTPSSGTVTNLTGTASININGTVGATTPSTGTFTTLTSTGRTVIKDLTETIATVTYAATITPDVANGTVQKVTLTGNVTFSAFANPVTGQSLTLIITQDGTGSRLLTSTMKFSGATKTLSTAASSIDIITVFYDGTNYYASLAKGFA